MTVSAHRLPAEGVPMAAEKIRRIFAQFPEIRYGFADISYSPFYPEYKSALVFAVPHEDPITLDNYTEERFEKNILNARKVLESVLIRVEDALGEHRIHAFIPPMPQQNEKDLLAVFSFKFAAVQAGLGWIGKSGVLITGEYGPRIRLGAVLVDFPFEPGVPITESRCGACRKCVDACPHGALKGVNWNIDTLRSNLIDYHLCNQRRSASIRTLGRKHACGLCMAACPFGTRKTP